MTKENKEHVTQFFYQNYDDSKIIWLENRKNLKDLAIDTQDDLNKAIVFTKKPYYFDYKTPVTFISKMGM